MKNSKLRRALLLLASAVLLVSLSVGATLAYLTDKTAEVKNTFVIGDVGFDETDDDDPKIAGPLDEAKVNKYGEPVNEAGKTEDEVAEGETWEPAKRVTENTYKLIPGHKYIKDPTVHIADDSEEAWLFVKVYNHIATLEDTDGTFTYVDVEGNEQTVTGNIAQQMEAIGWELLDADNGIWGYNDKVSANQDIVVFAGFKLNEEIEVTNAKNELEAYVTDNNANSKVTIQAFLVQADGVSQEVALQTVVDTYITTAP